MTIFQNERLLLDAFSKPVQDLISSASENAVQARASKIWSTHILVALLRKMDEEQEFAFQCGLKPGAQIRHVEETIKAYTKPKPGASAPRFTGLLTDFSRSAQEALKLLDAIMTESTDGIIATPSENLSVLHVWIAVLSKPEAEDIESLEEVFDFEKAKDAFQKLLAEESKILVPPLYSDESEELLLEYFAETSIEVLKRAVEYAGELGYEKLMPAHVFMALISRPQGVGEWLVRREAKLGVGPVKVVEEIERNISLGFRGKPKTLDLSRRYLSVPIQRVLENAYSKSIRRERKIIDESSLMYGILIEEREGRVADILKLPSLEIDIHKMLRHLDQYMKEVAVEDEVQQAAPFLLSKSVAKSDDLTYLAQTGRLSAMVEVKGASDDPSPLEQIKRGLHKRDNNHILITGPAGVGKTTIVRELARKIAAGEIPFLRNKKVLWVDCTEITPEESREKLEQIITAVKGRNDVITCLDGFESVIRYVGQRESNNLPLLKTALQNRHIHLIGVIQDRYYTELLGSEHQMLKFFARVEITEPDKDSARKIVEQIKPSLEKTYGVQIEGEAVDKAVILSRDFVLSEQLPTKAIETLEDACELASYKHEMALQSNDHGAEEKEKKPFVTDEHVITTVSQRTGVAESTLRGSGETVDFEALLRSSVVGQGRAVEAVARELKLIKGGAKDPTKPASIMLFAGLTGTGKTELAKIIAQVYSASKNLTVYTMGNFNESHSVSGIVGVPPGYVGYEMGGRLINDLNADPYSVVLLDEVDKAHPDIWKPFLNLFDEGWIVDQRNVKAYGNRAIFILTSNAGAELISQMIANKANMNDIITSVKKALLEVVHKSSGQRCFSPEFLARITQIIIFNPLSLEAMEAITILKLNKIKRTWREKRTKELDIHPQVVKHIATLGYAENKAGTEGGRIIPKLIAELIETPLQDKIAQEPEPYKLANKVRVVLDPSNHITCSFETTQPLSLEDAGKRATERIEAMLDDKSASPFSGQVEQAKQVIRDWERDVRAFASNSTAAQSVVDEEIQSLLSKITEIQQAFQKRESDLHEDLQGQFRSLMNSIRAAKPVKSYYSGAATVQGVASNQAVSDSLQGPIEIQET